MRLFHQTCFQFFALILACVGLALISPLESSAQSSANPRSIEVEGTGKASAKPDSLVLNGLVSSEDESAKKLPGKFLKIKKSLEETINPMDFPGVEIEFEGSTLKPNTATAAMLMAGGGEAAEGYRLSEPLRIRIEIDGDDSEKSILQRLSKLVDSAETAGASFSEASNPMMGVVLGAGGGAASLAQGILADTAKLKQEATDAAFEAAKAKAERLAKLAGGKIGKVISIAENTITEEADPTSAYMNMLMGKKSKESTGTINKIEVSQTLRVTFELTD